jgi:hypothetical protein
MINLVDAISKFRPANDRENDVAFYRTHVPWVGSLAYLNIIFKPAAPDVLLEVGAKMKIPPPYVEFLQRHNGADLLSGAISLYGVVRKGQLLKRSDPYSLPPFNIELENRSWPPPDRDRFLAIGGYGFDGSIPCIDRHDYHIEIFHRKAQMPYRAWESLDDWLTNEIQRVVELFDVSGRRLVDSSKTVPSPISEDGASGGSD